MVSVAGAWPSDECVRMEERARVYGQYGADDIGTTAAEVDKWFGGVAQHPCACAREGEDSTAMTEANLFRGVACTFRCCSEEAV